MLAAPSSLSFAAKTLAHLNRSQVTTHRPMLGMDGTVGADASPTAPPDGWLNHNETHGPMDTCGDEVGAASAAVPPQ